MVWPCVKDGQLSRYKSYFFFEKSKQFKSFYSFPINISYISKRAYFTSKSVISEEKKIDNSFLSILSDKSLRSGGKLLSELIVHLPFHPGLAG